MPELKILNIGILSWIIFLPLLGLIPVIFLPKGKLKESKWLVLGIFSLQLILALILWLKFNTALSGINKFDTLQFIEKWQWVNINSPVWSNKIIIEYFLAIDGLSLPFLILTPIVFIFSLLKLNTVHLSKASLSLLPLLSIGITGSFASLDFFLFFSFLTLTIIILYFLVNIIRVNRRSGNSISYLGYTFTACAIIFLIMLSLFVSSKDTITNSHTFNIISLVNPSNILDGSIISGHMSMGRLICFLSLTIAFGIIAAILPFHSWFTKLITETPTSIGIITAGIFIKIGIYGILRVCIPIFPDASIYFAYSFTVLAMINIIYHSFNSLAQTNFKTLIAYSAIVQTGISFIGIVSLTSQGINGAVLYSFNSGIVLILLLLLNKRISAQPDINKLGLNFQNTPKLFIISALIILSAISLPLFSGFIGTVLSYAGTISVPGLRLFASISILGIIIYSASLLWTFKKTFFTSSVQNTNVIPDLTLNELLLFGSLILLTIILGLFPSLLLNVISPYAEQLSLLLSQSVNLRIIGW